MDDSHVPNLLNRTDVSLIEAYFELQAMYEKEYGAHTVVIMEVGSFWEIYSVDNEIMVIGKTKEIAEILNLQMTRRSKAILENSMANPLLCGFPVATFDRYMARLVQENTYTIVIVRQRGIPPNVERFVDQILSPGVNFEYALDHEETVLVSLVIDQNNGIYSAGYAGIDITTGKSTTLDLHGTQEDNTFALDQLFSLVHSHRTAEIILTLIGTGIKEDTVRQYLEISSWDNVQIHASRPSITYQNELLGKAFAVESFLSPIEYLELERAPLTCEALCILIEFIVTHDKKVIENLTRPVMLNDTAYLYLGNHPLEQLNIVSRDPTETTVTRIMDYTVTSIGKRLLKERIRNPITNKAEIETRYDLSDTLGPLQKEIDAQLRNIYDLERIARRMTLARLHPFEVNFLHDSLEAAVSILRAIQNSSANRILSGFVDDEKSLQQLIVKLRRIFDLQESAKVLFADIHTSIFEHGYDQALDTLIHSRTALEQKMETIRMSIADMLSQKTGKDERDYVSIKQLDKEGHYIHLSKSRFFQIEKELQKQYISVDGTVHAFSDFTFKVQTSNVKITAPVIDQISEETVAAQTKIIALVKELFLREIKHIDQEFGTLLRNTIRALAQIDVALSNAKAQAALRLCRPQLLEMDTSFLEADELRHPLVETREDAELYVPNTVLLGQVSDATADTVFSHMNIKRVQGILLYGINSSGKSSLMKSLGVAVLLAQAGMYVPARGMRLTVFHELFTRIIAKDNFERGLSSFAVEMMELKNIFSRCSTKSLILGDEISHGTETLSAISIVTATVLRLIEKQSLFLFTTHLHQLKDLPMLRTITSLASVHLSVHYDHAQDCLVFDRTLQPGSGSSIYGLEFAQSLHMDETFLRTARDIRNELAGEHNDLTLITKKQPSKYNKKLLLCSCSICGNTVDETHHIHPQELADPQGNILHFHKNHKANLLPICTPCHDKIHRGEIRVHGYTMTSRGLQLQYTELDTHDQSSST
ncbi:MAG: DNA mismatch repair protein [Candidatus Magasanikbacteria bacterium CG10_big_fil_rev_8_21_14_0_10_47_10]|uniref:DNA mismatch repair protein n=1 Tax=Candidatus Magasanikbacteria bacterium CG10_big_fil_rev_8_21_14_0_10_47_10 TaxID=1974652 RepID=A0A2H0TSR7_9BACT|nr:MAG: DNA mismatch repair protein [Candidatus Magasanikbacteria bacterium CG10_big_fil_rev_8_21_14_0_10_47_10]